MSQVTIEVNGRPYVVGCEDGQESHLIELARAEAIRADYAVVVVGDSSAKRYTAFSFGRK